MAKDARRKLLDAALGLIRGQGYGATSVDELCQAAGVTKGAFFHHFRSKEDLGVAAAKHFGEMAEAAFATAPYRRLGTPVERLLGYVDFRRHILQGEMQDYTCLLGTMVQEVYSSHPAIRDACQREITGHAMTLRDDIAAAMAASRASGGWTATSLALHVQAVIQGAFILAKASGGPEVAAESLGHLRRYLSMLFENQAGREANS